jgi:HAE1 family hydrophobic/amphiphilic exporter-1
MLILLKEPKPYKGPLGWFFGKFNKGMDKSTDAYMSFTNVVTRKLKRGVVFIVILTIGAGVVGKLCPEVLFLKRTWDISM